MSNLPFDQRMGYALEEAARARRFLAACDEDEAIVVRRHAVALVAYRAAARTLARLDAEKAKS